MADIWEILKQFFLDHIQHKWLENHLLYFAIIAGVIIIALIIVYIRKLKKADDKIKKDAIKSRRKLLKVTSNKRNTSR